MFDGEFTGILDAGDARIEDIGLLMAGSLRIPCSGNGSREPADPGRDREGRTQPC
jgi:hypothetical protein